MPAWLLNLHAIFPALQIFFLVDLIPISTVGDLTFCSENKYHFCCCSISISPFCYNLPESVFTHGIFSFSLCFLFFHTEKKLCLSKYISNTVFSTNPFPINRWDYFWNCNFKKKNLVFSCINLFIVFLPWHRLFVCLCVYLLHYNHIS